MYRLLFLLKILILCKPILLLAKEPVNLSHDLQGETLGLHSYQYAGNLKGSELRELEESGLFEQSSSDFIEFGLLGTYAWQKVELYNPFLEPKEVYIWDEVSSSDSLVVFQDYNRVGSNSSRTALKNRFVSLTVPPQATSLVHVVRKTSSIQVHSWSFWSDLDALTDTVRWTYSLWAALAATFTMSILFNLILYASYRESVYLYYIGYLVSYGSFSTLLWGVFEGVELKHIVPVAAAAGIFSICYSVTFLGKEKIPSWGIKLLGICLTLEATTVILLPLFPVFSGNLLAWASVSVTLSIIALGLYTYLKYRETYYLVFNISYGTVMLGAIYQIASWHGLLPFVGHHLMDLGFLLENALMLSALGLKILATIEERKHGFKEMEKLLYPHQIEQISAGHDLESTMPVGSSEAVILSFDVIGSSKVKDIAFEERYESFMVACRELMMDGYDGVYQRSRGYMIKEVGDGFVCSVGYPFHSLRGQPFDEAYELAATIIERFNHMINVPDASETIFCAIGIAHGPVKAYFSRSGSVRHDLWGRGIVLAKRYESSRKAIKNVRNISDSHLIICQDEVFENLAENLKQHH